MRRIVLFSGGSACRAINIALCGKAHLTRVVPAWDSGGSSKVIREKLGLLAVGDLRQALMTMAHGEGRAGDVVKICNARLSSNLGKDDALSEFLYYSEGRHPLLERMEPGLRGAILNYLKTFVAAVGSDFDFRGGSIGNLILAGACLAHNGDINTAVFVFRKLCSVVGDVWTSSLDSDLVLSATLKNGKRIERQDAITKLDELDARVGIAEVRLSTESGAPPQANPATLEALASADLIAFGPGSFYTSLLPHLQIREIAESLSQVECPRVWIGNILQCRETTDRTLGDLLDVVSNQWHREDPSRRPLLTHVLANRVFFPFEKTVGNFPYLSHAMNEGDQCTVTTGEYEDAWNRGQHDGEAVARALIELVP
ncbi:gluconeogenesis factor YvcK family protein [Sinorhizobium sp. Sb3]|uniref:gluconeogenesis factor YvcK family protein n=1 Tax=Sinorhizobium sp. Sb3 TaxID=1358417 RepID=UPI00071CCAA2|nr:gluconeogenesis factor YvcK family protein [Sinorhizobium sp. Sb3]